MVARGIVAVSSKVVLLGGWNVVYCHATAFSVEGYNAISRPESVHVLADHMHHVVFRVGGLVFTGRFLFGNIVSLEVLCAEFAPTNPLG